MRKYIAFTVSVLVGLLASLGLAASASAAGETATAEFSIAAQQGPLYQGGPVPATWDISAHIRKEWDTNEPAPQYILPLTKVGFEVPSDMTFHPNNNKTPVCPDNKVGPNANMAVAPPAVIARCSNSVIANGTANLYLAKQNLPVVPPPGGAPQWIDDVALVAFNGGTLGGDPYIKLYGYSYKTNYGVFIPAVLEGNHLNVRVPWLSQNSAVGDFALSFPGKQFKFTNAFDQVVTIPGGMDPNYLRAKCSTGSWTMGTDFTMQQRDNNTKDPFGEFLEISAPDVTENCVGKPGKPPATGGHAKFSRVVVKAPRAVRRGGVATFVVRVKNVGNAPTRGVVVRGNGRGVRGGLAARMGSLRPGQVGAARVRTRAVGRRGSVALVRFVVNGRGVRAKASKVNRFRIR